MQGSQRTIAGLRRISFSNSILSSFIVPETPICTEMLPSLFGAMPMFIFSPVISLSFVFDLMNSSRFFWESENHAPFILIFPQLLHLGNLSSSSTIRISCPLRKHTLQNPLMSAEVSFPHLGQNLLISISLLSPRAWALLPQSPAPQCAS